MNFREDAGIEHKSIQASLYHHSNHTTNSRQAVTSLRPGFLITKIFDASNSTNVIITVNKA